MEDRHAKHLSDHNDQEKIRHESAIRQLSEEFAVQPELMRSVNEEILGDLASQATIKDYLSIFVARTIRDLLAGSPSPSLPSINAQIKEKYRKMLTAGTADN